MINHWVNSGDPAFPPKNKVPRYLFHEATHKIYDYIESFCQRNGKPPTHQSLANKFEDYVIFEPMDIDPVDAVLYAMKGRYMSRASVRYIRELAAHAEDETFINSLKTFQVNIDKLIKEHTTEVGYYSWIKNAMDRYQEYMKRHGRNGLLGYPTGLSKLDELTGGIQEDDFVLITGRTGQGKSLLGDFIGFNVWKHCVKNNITNPVLCINTEMTASQVSFRLDALKAHISNTALRLGKLADTETYENYLKRLADVENDYIIITQDELGRNITPMDIQSLIDEKKPCIVIIDQLYDIHDGTGERDIRKRIVNVSNALRDINLKTKVPFLVMAQAGREAAREAKKDTKATPEIHQVQESDNPAQKATKFLSLRLSGDAMMISLKKNRDGKKDEDIYLKIDIDKGIWEEIEKEEEQF
jgi:replicative DNA helicase